MKMRDSPTEPVTQAGRALLLDPLADDSPLAAILAIEAQARADANAEIERLRAALREAFAVMDAACRWAAGQTTGMTTMAQVDEHVRGFDALVDGTTRAQKALSDLEERANEQRTNAEIERLRAVVKALLDHNGHGHSTYACKCVERAGQALSATPQPDSDQ